MKLLKYFLALSRAKQIAIAVCAVHLLTIFGLICHHFASRRLTPPRNMIVRTVTPITEKKIQSAPAPKVVQQAAAPAAPPKPKPAASVKKAAAPAKAAPVAKKSAPVKDERLLKEISESLETFTIESKQTKLSLALPSKIKPKAERVEETPTYGEFLIGYLQTALDLPEYGEVRARLEIDRFGRLIDCEILEAKSHKNADFLKNQLPQLTFPCLNDFGIVDATQQFTITFRNVEMH
jgi:hypothetical protein